MFEGGKMLKTVILEILEIISKSLIVTVSIMMLFINGYKVLSKTQILQFIREHGAYIGVGFLIFLIVFAVYLAIYDDIKEDDE